MTTPIRVETYHGPDIHGRVTNPQSVGIRQSRRIQTNRKNLFHKPRNGVMDPVTYWHILDTMLSIQPGQVFRTTHLIELNMLSYSMLWDSVTVGRVMNDIADAANEAAGFKVIAVSRHYDGLWYDITGVAEGRALLEALLEDLDKLATQELQEEARGIHLKRVRSPLESCPSVKL